MRNLIMSFPSNFPFSCIKITGQMSAKKEAMVPALPGEESLESLLIKNRRKKQKDRKRVQARISARCWSKSLTEFGGYQRADSHSSCFRASQRWFPPTALTISYLAVSWVGHFCCSDFSIKYKKGKYALQAGHLFQVTATCMSDCLQHTAFV